MKKGEKMSLKLKEKLSIAHKGKKTWNTGTKGLMKPNKTTFKKGMIPWNKGKEAYWIKGNKNPRWVNDRTKLQKYNDINKDRISSIYREWRLKVYQRDGYKCRINNCDCKGRIIAHHILSYTKYPELRYEINNGITLCKFHHPLKRIEEQKLINDFRKLIDSYN